MKQMGNFLLSIISTPYRGLQVSYKLAAQKLHHIVEEKKLFRRALLVVVMFMLLFSCYEINWILHEVVPLIKTVDANAVELVKSVIQMIALTSTVLGLILGGLYGYKRSTEDVAKLLSTQKDKQIKTDSTETDTSTTPTKDGEDPNYDK